jgi:hypothetical protein
MHNEGQGTEAAAMAVLRPDGANQDRPALEVARTDEASDNGANKEGQCIAPIVPSVVNRTNDAYSTLLSTRRPSYEANKGRYRQGEQPENYVAMLRLGDLVELLVAAGYDNRKDVVQDADIIRCNGCGEWTVAGYCKSCEDQ